jgi:hypothetical protein
MRIFQNIKPLIVTLSSSIKLIGFLLFCTYGFSQNVTSTIDSSKIKIGSQFHLIIKAKVTKQAKVVFPSSEFIGLLEVLESLPIDTVKTNDALELIKKYGLTQFDSGRYEIPPLQVIIDGKTLLTTQHTILVNDVVVDTLKQKMFDIRTIINVEKPANYLWLYISIGFLLILLIGYLVYRYIKNKQDKVNNKQEVVFASPIEKAIALLEQLDKKELIEKGETKTYYSELTDISRVYLEEVVEIPAMESTSTELFAILKAEVKKRSFKLNNEALNKFKKVMATADLVKFAKSKPLDFEIEYDKNTIKEFLISLDKAIPRTEEEKENLFAEELQRKKEITQRKQRILIPLSIVVFLLLVSGVFLTVTKGTDYIRDNFIGYSSKTLLNSDWILSEYGEPSILIETPKALIRQNNEQNVNNLPVDVKSNSTFVYGSLTDPFSIILKTTAFKDSVDLSIDSAIESDLRYIEVIGGQNIIGTVGTFETEKGLSGKKGTGTFTLKGNNEDDFINMRYEIIVFVQNAAAQEIFLVFKDDDSYAEQIVERILNSVELAKTTQK